MDSPIESLVEVLRRGRGVPFEWSVEHGDLGRVWLTARDPQRMIEVYARTGDDRGTFLAVIACLEDVARAEPIEQVESVVVSARSSLDNSVVNMSYVHDQAAIAVGIARGSTRSLLRAAKSFASACMYRRGSATSAGLWTHDLVVCLTYLTDTLIQRGWNAGLREKRARARLARILRANLSTPTIESLQPR